MQAFISYLSNFDSTFIYALQSIGPKWEPVAYFISHGVGSYPLMFAAFFIALLFVDKWRIALELAIVTAISFGVLWALKHYFAIARPYVMDPNVISYGPESSFAFPSGHALMSVVILGWVALRHPKSHVLLWGTVILVLLIGASRVYLGAHYPTQVVAGWLFGTLLIYIFRNISKRLWSPFQKQLSRR